MADKVQNVRINFITGPTPELQRAEALLAKAQQSTDRLNQATQNFNRTATTGGKQVATTIDGLVLKQQQLAAQIRLTSTADTKRLQDLSTQYKALSKQISDLNKQYLQQNNATKANADSTQQLAGQFNTLYNAIRLVVTAGIVREIVDTSLNLAVLAGNVEGVGRAFERQIPNSTGLLRELRRATQNAVTDLELMQKSLQAQNFGIDVQRLPELLEFAAVRAQQTGVSVDYLVNSIVTGIGRKSILILDNLGISATRLREQFNGASLASQSVGDVTRAVADIAQQEMQKMGGYVETAATQVDQLKVSWQELRVETAKYFTEGAGGGVIATLKDYVDTFKLAVEAQNRGLSVSELSTIKRIEDTAAVSANEFATRALTGSREENIKVLEEEIQRLTHQVGLFAQERDAAVRTVKALDELRQSGQANAYVIQEQIRLQERLIESKQEDALIDQEILRNLQARLSAMTKQNQATQEQITTIEVLREQLKGLQQQREEETFVGNTAELDRLQRLIILKEDEILKVSDRIEWEKKWGQAQQVTAAIEKMRTEDLEELNKKIAEFANIDLSNLEQNATKVKAFFSAFGLEDTEGTVKALEDNVTFLKNILEPLEDVDFSGIEIEPEVAINPTITNESRVRFRIRLREILGSDMVDSFIGAQEELKASAIDIISEQLVSIEQAQIASLENQLSHLREFYDEQQILAGDNERAKSELRLKEERETNALRSRIAEKEKRAKRFQIIIDTAAAVMRTASELGYPAAIPFIAIAVAQGLSQLAIVNRTPARFAKGVIDLQGPGTTTSDSIPARLSRRESVMTAEETIKAKGILTDIRAKRLDDRVMANLRKPSQNTVNVFNDERIISELREMRKNQPDIIEQYGTLYKVSGRGTALQKRIRAKRISG